MSVFTDLAARVRALLFWRRQDRELDDEMRFHLEHEIAERVRRGEPPATARRHALLAFGGVDRFMEETRDARGVSPVIDLVADLRYALRGLRRNPGFAAAAILVLGLAIGVTTATFAVVDAVLIAELPFPDARRLVRIYPNQTLEWMNLSSVDYEAIREQARSFDAVGAVSPRVMALSGAGEPQRVVAGRVTGGFFEALRVRPAAGRLVDASDEAPGAPAVVVVSRAMAERLFGGVRSAVGRAITLDGRGYEVIGVLRADRAVRAGVAGIRADVWPALQLVTPTRRGPFWLRVFARLEEGATLDDARRELAGVSERIFPLWVSSFQDQEARFTPVPLRAAIVGSADARITLFAGAVVLVLIGAVVNVATLLLVRAAGRASELSMRAALGASRGRVARLLLIEGLTVAALAGVAGIIVAGGGLRFLGALAPDLPRLAEVGFGGRALALAAAVTAAAGILISLSPVAALGSRSAGASLRSDPRRSGGTRKVHLARGALVVGQFAIALPLLLGAGLLLNSLVRLQRVDPGFDPAGIVTVSVSLPSVRYGDSAAAAFWRRVSAQAADVPGIAAVGLSTELPPDEPFMTNNFDLVDHPVPAGASQPTSPWALVTNDYFRVLNVPRLAGRLFTHADSAGAPPVVVVSRAWAERHFPGEDAVGRQLIEGGCVTCPRTTVVGVVGDVKYLGRRNPAEAVYVPFAQWGARSAHVVVRSRVGVAETHRILRDLVQGLDPELPVAEGTLEGRLDAELADPRRWTAVIGGFGTAAAALAALGVFGLMSFVVRQRRRDIGVRLALGADPAVVTRMVVGQGMRLAAVGGAAGLILGAAAARWLRGLLFEVGAADPVTVAAVAGVLGLAALVACWLPGRAAARIPPAEAIAAE